MLYYNIIIKHDNYKFWFHFSLMWTVIARNHCDFSEGTMGCALLVNH